LSLAQRNALHTLLASRTSDAFTTFGDEIITGGASAPMYEWQSPDELRGQYKEYATQE
jgi:hypothetical protein